MHFINPQRSILSAILLTFLICSDSFSQAALPPLLEKVNPPLYVVTVEGKDGFINRKGKLIIKTSFDKAYPFTEGLAAVQQEGLWGFIDTKGRVVIKPQFIMVGMFSDGLASFRHKRYSDPWGYIDATGKVVIKPQFDSAGKFRKGIARVGFETNESKLLGWLADTGITCDYKYIAPNGKFVPKPPPQHFATGKPDELIPFRKDGLAGFTDSAGQIVIKAQFETASTFSEGLACVSKNGLFGYIDKNGKWVIAPRFKYANSFSEGLAGVSQEGKNRWGFIDHTGKIVIPSKFAWVYGGFRHGVAEVAFDSKRGYISPKGEWIWQPSE